MLKAYLMINFDTVRGFHVHVLAFLHSEKREHAYTPLSANVFRFERQPNNHHQHDNNRGQCPP
jgi:hypothetical protein